VNAKAPSPTKERTPRKEEAERRERERILAEQKRRMAKVPGISGDWEVDTNRMMASYMQEGLGKFDAALKVVSFYGMRVTFSGNTIRVRKDGRDCTATFETLRFDSQDKLIAALVDYGSPEDAAKARRVVRGQIRTGETDVVIAKITKHDNNGDGMDYFKVGQKCVFFLPGSKSTSRDEMVFTCRLWGDDVAPSFLVRANSPRGRQLIRERQERKKNR